MKFKKNYYSINLSKYYLLCWSNFYLIKIINLLNTNLTRFNWQLFYYTSQMWMEMSEHLWLNNRKFITSSTCISMQRKSTQRVSRCNVKAPLYFSHRRRNNATKTWSSRSLRLIWSLSDAMKSMIYVVTFST